MPEESNLCVDQTDYTERNLEGRDSTGWDLGGVSFRDSNLENASFANANLYWSSFDGANLTNCSFRNADLRRVVSWEAILINVDFSGADFSLDNVGGDTDFSGIDLSRTCLAQANLSSAYFDEHTSFPKGFDPASKGMIRH